MTSLESIAPSGVKEAMTAKGYQLFEREGVPNIVGIRSYEPEDKSDVFNDKCFVWWKKGDGKNEWHSYTITTHPGRYYLEHPLAGTKGTAILVPGQYLDCWTLGMHRGKQFALCQTNGQVKVYRDDDKDLLMNFDPATIQEGYFGIDLHHSDISDANVIDHWSAGCQVWRYHDAHSLLMQKFKGMSEFYKFRTFSYTLLLQSDFI